MESKGLAGGYRRELAERLREDSDEIARAIAGRMWALRGGHGDLPEGLEGAVRAALAQAFRAIEGKKDRHAPPEVIAYSRKLAEERFETSVLMRWCYQCLTVFRERLRQADASIKGRSQAGYAAADRAIDHFFERLQEAVEEAHRDEDEYLKRPSSIRLREEVRQLLTGKLIYPPEDFGYDMSATHVGVVGSGPGVEADIRRLAKMLGGQLLIVQDSPDRFWAWIGLKRQESAARLADARKVDWGDTVHMGIGEPARGLPGWRSTHFQATAALRLALREEGPLVRYGDDPLLASTLMDEFLQASLRDIYVVPILTDSGGDTLCDTLHAFFASGQQKASTAATLGVSRQVVSYRIRSVERLLGQPLERIASALDLAVRLDRLDRCSG